jgi:tungstate transport system substrate-binding protein
MQTEEGFQRLLAQEGVDRLERLGRILEAVAGTGSLHRATRALAISYRQAWELVRRVEALLGEPLMTRRAGGKDGGGAALTPLGQEVAARCARLRAELALRLVTPVQADPHRPILLASTIGPAEVGLLDALEAAFHQATGLWVRHIAAGSGQALALARSGRVDLVLSHAPAAEAQFMAEGWGAGRYPLMVNHFVLAGPPADPAGVRTAASAADAMARIARAGARFLSRADRSGTHLRELELWQAAGVEPSGPWYIPYVHGGQGSGVTLREAGRIGAYTLVDQATFHAAALPQLAILFAGDDALANPFHLIALHPRRFPQAHHQGAQRFIQWATGPEGQAVIRQFGHFVPAGEPSSR